MNPWDGKDAGDAVVLMDIGFDKLREHLRPTYRGHRTMTNGGVQPDIIRTRDRFGGLFVMLLDRGRRKFR